VVEYRPIMSVNIVSQFQSSTVSHNQPTLQRDLSAIAELLVTFCNFASCCLVRHFHVLHFMCCILLHIRGPATASDLSALGIQVLVPSTTHEAFKPVDSTLAMVTQICTLNAPNSRFLSVYWSILDCCFACSVCTGSNVSFNGCNAVKVGSAIGTE